MSSCGSSSRTESRTFVKSSRVSVPMAPRPKLAAFRFALAILISSCLRLDFSIAAMPLDGHACVIDASKSSRVTIEVESVHYCLRNRLPIEFRNVEIKGPINLARVEPALFDKLEKERLVGVGEPEKALGLRELENEIKQPIFGIRPIRERFVIRDSRLSFSFFSDPSLGNQDPAPYYPLVFVKKFDLSGSTVIGQVNGSKSYFLDDFIAEKTHFTHSLDFSGTRFRQEANFLRARFEGDSVDFSEAIFAGRLTMRCLNLTSSMGAGSKPAFYFMGAKFLGPVKFDCDSALGFVNFFGAEFKSSHIRFDEVKFEETAQFSSAVFDERPFFNGAVFSSSAVFNRAIFHKGVAFIGAKFLDGVDFRGAELGRDGLTSFDTSEISGNAVFSAVNFIGRTEFRFTDASKASIDFRDATFGEKADFHRATFCISSFKNSRFREAAVFTATTFGVKSRFGVASNLSVDFGEVSFDEVVNFTGVRFVGPVNLSHTVYPVGKLLVAWDELAEKVRSVDATFGPLSKGGRQVVLMVRSESEQAMRESEMFKRLEVNYRALDRLSDATEVYFLRRQAEALEGTGKSGVQRRPNASVWLYIWDQTTALIPGGRLSEFYWGYGVRPWRIFRALIFLLVIMASVIYFRGAIVHTKSMPAVPKWKPSELPLRSRWYRHQTYLAPGSSRRIRVILSIVLSLDILTGLRLWSVALVEVPLFWATCMVLMRVLGIAALVMFLVSFAQVIPVVGEMLSFLL